MEKFLKVAGLVAIGAAVGIGTGVGVTLLANKAIEKKKSRYISIDDAIASGLIQSDSVSIEE